MDSERVQEIVDRALIRARKRLQSDGRDQGPVVRSVLRYVADHLLDPTLHAGAAMRAVGLSSSSFTTTFAEKVGFTLQRYITDLRIGMSTGLLLDNSDLKIPAIGRRLGFSSGVTFSRAFKRHLGLTPTQYRERRRTQPTPGEESSEADTVSGWPSGAEPAVGVSGEPLEPIFVMDPALLIAEKAREVWEYIRDRPPEEQRRRLQILRFTDDSLVSLLLEKSLTEGRSDRRLGLQLAELALYVVEISRSYLRVDVETLEARVWNCIGNNRKFTYDYVAAEDAFLRSERLLGGKCTSEAKRARAQLLLFGAALKDLQYQPGEALKFATKAIALFSDLGDRAGVASALILKGNVLGFENQLEKANSLHLQGLEIAREIGEPALQLVGLGSLASNHASLGNTRTAEAYLAEARDSLQPQSVATARFHLDWVEGLIEIAKGREERAEAAFLKAKAGFEIFEELNYAALVALDLCILYRQTGQRAEVVELAQQTRTIFESLRATVPIAAAKKLLIDAIKEERLSVETLRLIQTRVRRPLADHARGT